MKTRIATISAMLGIVVFSMAFSSCKDEEDEPTRLVGINFSMVWVFDETVESFRNYSESSYFGVAGADPFSGACIYVDPAEESFYPFVSLDDWYTKVKIIQCKVDGITVYKSYDKDDPTDSVKYYAPDYVAINFPDAINENPMTIIGDWYMIDLDGIHLTVFFKPNDSGKERTLYFRITPLVDSAPYYTEDLFYFSQAAQQDAESGDSEDTEDTVE